MIFYRVFSQLQLTVTWQPLQIMSDSTKRWPSDKVNHSCENALYFPYFSPIVWNICTIVLDLTRARQYVHIYSSTFISTAQHNATHGAVQFISYAVQASLVIKAGFPKITTGLLIHLNMHLIKVYQLVL